MAWEYTIMTQIIPIDPHYFEETDQEGLAEGLAGSFLQPARTLSEFVANPPPGMLDSHVISHDVVRVGSCLLLTVLMRYQLPKHQSGSRRKA